MRCRKKQDQKSKKINRRSFSIAVILQYSAVANLSYWVHSLFHTYVQGLLLSLQYKCRAPIMIISWIDLQALQTFKIVPNRCPKE